jgi:sugar phosphate isomerase/epimerase
MKTAIVLASESEVIPLGLRGDFEKNIKYVSEIGFDGAELSIMDIRSVDPKKIKEITKRYGLIIPAIGAGRYFSKNGFFFSSKEKDVRQKAIKEVNKYIKFSSQLNSHFIIGLVQGNFENSYEEGFKYVEECLQECVRVAEAEGVILLLEPINHLSPGIIRTVGEGIRMLNEVNSSSIKLLIDTYHMNIEERSITESIKKAKGYIGHVHLSDDNRLAPGQGHIDFGAIAKILKEIGYQGFVSGEILPEPDGETAAKCTIELMKSLFIENK